jgi:hypothetical protein
MPAPQTSSEASETGAPHTVAVPEAGEVHAALHGDLEREARFWRARAEQLAAEMAALQARLVALAEHLPARYAQLLTCDPADLERAAGWLDPLASWQETTTLKTASVAAELSRLWARLHPLR